jgi:hypothetical protein
MTARIGYLAALAPSQGGPSALRPPRRMFPAAAFLDAEPDPWQVPPGVAEADSPARRGLAPGSPGDGHPGDSRPGDGHPGDRQAGEGQDARRRMPVPGPDARCESSAPVPMASIAPAGIAPHDAAAGSARIGGITQPGVTAEPAAAAIAVRPDETRPAAGSPGPASRRRPPEAVTGPPGHPAGMPDPHPTGQAGSTAVHAVSAAAGLGASGPQGQARLIPASPRPGSTPPKAGAAGSAVTAPGHHDAVVRQSPRQVPGPAAPATHTGHDPAPHGVRMAGPAGAEPGHHAAAVQHGLQHLPTRQPVPEGPAAGRLPAPASPPGPTARAARAAQAATPWHEAGSQMSSRFPAAARPPEVPGGPAVRPSPPRQTRAQAAPTPAGPRQSTLSIGTIEVTLLAQPQPQPPAASSRRSARPAPDRLSHGIGARFGRGQT